MIEVNWLLHKIALTGALEDSMASELQLRGFGTEVRESPCDENWLVLARHRLVSAVYEIAAVRESMQALVETAGGEYDGWEVAFQ